MKPLRIVDSVVTPDGRELVLYQRDDFFVIQVDRHELMSSRAHGSEDDLARLAIAAIAKRPAPRLLIGGLGMGFTLRAALDGLEGRPGAKVTVAEIFPAVIEWNREHLAHLAKSPLTDRRARVIPGDVAERLTPETFDAILLDVDNGPEAFTVDHNRYLYTPAGLERLRDALTPGGVLTVWSAGDDPRFVYRLDRAGFDAAVHRVRARASGKGGHHVIFVARRP